jgi:Xaa-Pro aminopeptidase
MPADEERPRGAGMKTKTKTKQQGGMLSALRRHLAERELDGFLLPSHDEYRSEMPPERNKRLRALTGFSGSFGVALVFRDRAFLVTDGRYRLQARAELNPAAYEAVDIAETKPEALLAQWQKEYPRIGYDPLLLSKAEHGRYVKAAPGCVFVPLASNPVDVLWESRPPTAPSPAFPYPEKYAGDTARERLLRLAAVLKEKKAEYYFEPLPEQICRLLNVRGADAPNTPVVFSRLLVRDDATAVWFVDPARVPGKLQAKLAAHGVAVREEGQCAAILQGLPAEARVLADPAAVPMRHAEAASHAAMLWEPSPVALMQACKTQAEVAAIAEAHIVDGLALTRFLYWLERERRTGNPVSETDIVAELRRFRAMSPDYRGDSFDAIAGVDGNGAIVHYRPTEATAKPVREDSMVLIDSGGQYLQGTTDVTRTLCLFRPTEEQKRDYTLVLKGHIALARAVFPDGATGGQLDALARQFLWRNGKDYAHGTGHGVGCFLGVHEGPQRIGKAGGDAALKPGMILSNEPGYYKEGEYGIRIENLVVVEPHPGIQGERPFYRFRTLTLAPMDARLVLPSLLDADERAWLKEYHDAVYAAHAARLSEEEQEWLAEIAGSI